MELHQYHADHCSECGAGRATYRREAGQELLSIPLRTIVGSSEGLSARDGAAWTWPTQDRRHCKRHGQNILPIGPGPGCSDHERDDFQSKIWLRCLYRATLRRIHETGGTMIPLYFDHAESTPVAPNAVLLTSGAAEVNNLALKRHPSVRGEPRPHSLC